MFLIWKEANRKSRFLTNRIIAVLLMLGSITAWLLQPMTITLKDSSSIILLTKNYDRNKADSLIKKYPSYTLLKEYDAAAYKNSIELMPYALVDHKDNIAFILGEGLPYYEQEKIASSYSYFPSKLPTGITQLNLPEPVQVNQTASISGTANIHGKTTLILEQPGGSKDSVVLTGMGIKSFSLSSETQQTGLFRYSVVLRDSLTSKVEGYLPVEVTPHKILNILFVQKYPSAEVRYLKNFLTEKGHALAIRSQISKNDFHYEFANRESIRIDRLTSESLSEFDLFIMDTESLHALSASELKSLERSVTDGLGVVVLINSIDPKRNFPLLNASFQVYPHDTVHLQIKNQNIALPALPVSISSRLSITPVTTSTTRILSGYRHEVAGKIGFQLLHETYRLLLEGKITEYASLWSPLLESIARLKTESFKIKIKNSFPYYQDEPLAVQVISAGDEPKLKTNHTILPLQEDVLIDDYWHATTWAGKAGWDSLTTQDSSTLHYYVSPDNEWTTLRIANQQRQHFANQSNLISKKETSLTTDHKPISPLWFLMIFLLASGFLWLTPKI
ncbi:hypothetical protein MASR2M41_03000 [Flammeovirgaceae bacterium]